MRSHQPNGLDRLLAPDGIRFDIAYTCTQIREHEALVHLLDTLPPLEEVKGMRARTLAYLAAARGASVAVGACDWERDPAECLRRAASG
jgi:hypothetical protein